MSVTLGYINYAGFGGSSLVFMLVLVGYWLCVREWLCTYLLIPSGFGSSW